MRLRRASPAGHLDRDHRPTQPFEGLSLTTETRRRHVVPATKRSGEAGWIAEANPLGDGPQRQLGLQNPAIRTLATRLLELVRKGRALLVQLALQRARRKSQTSTRLDETVRGKLRLPAEQEAETSHQIAGLRQKRDAMREL